MRQTNTLILFISIGKVDDNSLINFMSKRQLLKYFYKRISKRFNAL